MLYLLKYNRVSRFLLPSLFGEGSGERLYRVCFRLLLPHSAPSNTSGYLANLSPLSFRRGTGRGFCRASVQAFEIPLQIIRRHCSQINPLSLKTGFVTYRESVSYKQTGKRCPFALQNMPFYTSKDALLHCKRASFTTQKGVDGKRKGKKLTKTTPKIRPPQAQR